MLLLLFAVDLSNNTIMSSNGNSNDLLKRLENITLEVEAEAAKHSKSVSNFVQQCSQAVGEACCSCESSKGLVILSNLIKNLEKSCGNSIDELPQSLVDYENMVKSTISNYVSISNKIGGDVASHAALVQAAFYGQFSLLKMASKYRRPKSNEDIALICAPYNELFAKVLDFFDQNRNSEFSTHLEAVRESASGLVWIGLNPPTPASFVKEYGICATYYTNRILMKWKAQDSIHADWCKAWHRVFLDLETVIRKHFEAGYIWNFHGLDPADILAPKSLPAGPPAEFLQDIKAESPTNKTRNALFDQINQGGDVVKGLKKVGVELQNHKNKGVAKLPCKEPSVVAASSSLAKPPKVGNSLPSSAKLVLDGRRWMVENFCDANDIKIDDVELSHAVYVYKCHNSVVHVNGKCSSIVVDNCNKFSIVFKSVVSSIEFINCKSVKMQVLDSVQTVSVNKTDGCQIYLSKNSIGVEILSAKSSEMNIMIPQEDDDYIERPIPEQFKTSIVPGESVLVTECVKNC